MLPAISLADLSQNRMLSSDRTRKHLDILRDCTVIPTASIHPIDVPTIQMFHEVLAEQI